MAFGGGLYTSKVVQPGVGLSMVLFSLCCLERFWWTALSPHDRMTLVLISLAACFLGVSGQF